MISVTGYKQFKNCPRQWFYKNIVADARVKKDPFRREVTLLSKLQTVQAWRGNVVDNILSKYLVLAINNKYPIKKEYFINQAMMSFDTQLEYAIFQKYKQPEAVITNNPDFNALLDCELGSGVSDEEISAAKEDIIKALTNLLDDLDFIEYLKGAKYVISQRPLVYSFDRFSVKAKPDFIAFFDNSPPHIFDWKVHTYGTTTYDEQLIAYAVALYKVALTNPHADFPKDLSNYKIYDYKLSEYQLLHKDRIKRNYEVTAERIDEFGENLATGIIEMHMAGANKKYDKLKAEDFSTAKYVEYCENCPFKKICKTGNYETSIEQVVRSEYFQN